MKLQEFVQIHKEDVEEFRREFLRKAIGKDNIPLDFTYSVWIDLFCGWADYKRSERDKE